MLHDPAACVVTDGKVVAMVEEERLSRVKRASNQLPTRSVMCCLNQAGLTFDDIDVIAASWNPELDPKEDRYRHYVTWLMNEEPFRGCRRPPVEYVQHHLAHAASTYFGSGFSEAAIIVVDGAGEVSATSLGFGSGTKITLEQKFGIRDSLGLFYAFAAEHSGLCANNEGKLMGLAAYGDPTHDIDLVRLESDGYHVDFPHVPDLPLRDIWAPLYGAWTEWFTQRFGEANQAKYVWDTSGSRFRHSLDVPETTKNLAASVQKGLERTLVHLVDVVTRRYNTRKVVIAGGVGLNCSANGAIRRSGLVDELYVMPAAYDAGGAIGAALFLAAQAGTTPRTFSPYLGPEYDNDLIVSTLSQAGINYTEPPDLEEHTADLLAKGRIVGWFQGRMEIGPRALGHRSILALPSTTAVRDGVNRLKGREHWRPLSPSVLEEESDKMLEDSRPSPYMLVADRATPWASQHAPAVVHVDGTARAQTVSRDEGRYHRLIERVYQRTGIPALLNTSFNLDDEPIVCTPRDALRTFVFSDLDALVIGDVVVEKRRN